MTIDIMLKTFSFNLRVFTSKLIWSGDSRATALMYKWRHMAARWGRRSTQYSI